MAIAYGLIPADPFHDTPEANRPTRKYAWLEYDEGFWHFLTNPFADPNRAARKWNDEHGALRELENEGWIVVYPYNQNNPLDDTSGEQACGYGLMRVDRRLAS